MKSKILSKIVFISAIIFSLNMAASVAYAQELIFPESIDEANITEGETVITPRGEVTGYKYMTVNGVKYKRLWSYTGGYWIDPYWIPCD